MYSLAPSLSIHKGQFCQTKGRFCSSCLKGLNTRTQNREYVSTKNSLVTPPHSQRLQRTSSRREARGQNQQVAHQFHTLKTVLICSTGLTPKQCISPVAGLNLVRPSLQSACHLPEVQRKRGCEQECVQESLQIQNQFFENLALVLQNVFLGRFLQEHSACYDCNKMTETMAKNFESQADCTYGLQLLIHSQD